MFSWQLKIKKRAAVVYNIFVICLEQFRFKTRYETVIFIHQVDDTRAKGPIRTLAASLLPTGESL